MTNNKTISDLKDPEGWTVENNPHKAPDYCRVYNDKDGSNWIDYMEYFGVGEYICHQCIVRAKYGSGNCQDNGDYFLCVRTGKRAKWRKELEHKYSQKRYVQTKLM